MAFCDCLSFMFKKTLYKHIYFIKINLNETNNKQNKKIIEKKENNNSKEISGILKIPKKDIKDKRTLSVENRLKKDIEENLRVYDSRHSGWEKYNIKDYGVELNSNLQQKIIENLEKVKNIVKLKQNNIIALKKSMKILKLFYLVT